MIEVYLVVPGLIFFAWLYLLIRQTRQGMGVEQETTSRPVVPVHLMDTDEAVIVAEGRGRIVYANDLARNWFGINGGAPNLALMSLLAQPPDTLHDLIADAGHASFRLGQRRIEAVSHPIPSSEGRRMVVVMRELTAAALQTYTEFDPLRALAILGDISQAVGTGLDLSGMVDAILRSIGQSIAFDSAQVTLWQSETEMLRPVPRPGDALAPDAGYRMGEGYSGWIAMYRQPLLIGDMNARFDVSPRMQTSDLQSYVGVPMSIADRFVGTLELMSRERSAFGQRDMMLLQTISGQVAAAVEAARLYRDQTTRVAELSGLQQISEAMSQLGEMTELYAQITQRIAHLINVELCGVLLYDETEQVFRSQPPFYGVPNSLIEDYRLEVQPDTELYAIWRHQPWWYTNEPQLPMLLNMGFDNLRTTFSFNSLALVPMIVGARRIGLLLAANKHDQQGFQETDMRVLMSFASQAAVVVENARLYAEEQRRTRELGGLQQIAQAMGVLRNPGELYSQITERIAHLMGVQMCGVLLYDPGDRVLVSQTPFYGMDDPESVSFYQLPSPPGSLVARLWHERNYWFSNDLRRDPAVNDSDLARMASAVGIHQTVIAPLVVGGNRLGIIQVSNKLDGTDFIEDDARILSIFAGQAAILIDNARLYREMQSRTHEAEGLRAITEIASQVTAQGESLEQVLVAIANLLESQVVLVALVDDKTGQLVMEPSHTWGITLTKPYRIDAYAPGFEDSVLVSRRPFTSANLREDQRVLPQYHELAERFNLQHVIQVPLLVQDRSIGELTIANRTTNEPYAPADVQLTSAIATQIAAMVDRMRLYQVTDQDLRVRLQELDALSRVSHELSQTLELDRILDAIRQEALRSTAATAATILLLADRQDWQDQNEPQIERRFGETRSLSDLTPAERAAIERNDVLTVADYTDSPFEAVPAAAQSALLVPIAFGQEVVGLIHLYSDQTKAFDRRVADFVLALTDQAAIAIGNSRRYQEQLQANRQLRVRAERMGRIFELGEIFRQGATLPELMEEVAHSVQETVGFNMVLISLVDSRARVLRRTAQAGMPLSVFDEIRQITPPLDQVLGLLQDQYRVSHSYFLPAEGAAELTADLPLYQPLQERMGSGPRAWDPQDVLIVPFYGTAKRLLGIMTVDEPRSGRRPDLATVEALEIFASQAAFAIENYRLVERIQQEAEATRHERDRLAQLHLVASEIQNAPDVPSRLQVVANGIHDAGWGKVVITLRDEHLEPTAMIQAGYSPDEALVLSDEVLSGKVWRTWINDLSFYDLRLGAGYYLRYNHPWVREHIFEGRAPEPPEVLDDEWHPQDTLYLPLVGQDQKRIIGIIAMADPVDGKTPTEASLQPFELFASQAAAAIETTRLYLETVRAAEQEQRLNEMMEVVSSSLQAGEVIRSIGNGLQQMVPFTRMCVALYNAQMSYFDQLRAEIALDSSINVVQDKPIAVEGTSMGQAFREGKPRIYRLRQEESVRDACQDLTEWYASGERSTLVVPMIAAGQTVGVLHLGSELENAFGFQENLPLIQRLSNLSAVALDNARLFQQANEREQFSAAMRRVSQSLNQIFDLSSVLRTICDESVPILSVEGAYVWLVTGSDLMGIAASGPAHDAFIGMTVPLGNQHALPSQVVAERKPIYINDLQEREDRVQLIPLEELQTVYAVLCVPLLREDRVLGALMLIEANEGAHFDDLDVEQSLAFAVQAAIAIENARLFEETGQRASELDAQARRLALINRVSTRLAQSLNPQEIYEIALHELQEVLGGQFGSLTIFESKTQGRLMLDTHPSARSSPDGTVVKLTRTPSIDYVRQKRRPLVSEDALSDTQFKAIRKTLKAQGTQSLIIVPLIVSDRVMGAIRVDFTTRRAFTPIEVELAETIASQVAVALDKANLLEEAERRAAELHAQAQRLALVNRISTRLAQTLDPQEIYAIVLSELSEMLQVQQGGLMLFETEKVGRLVLSYPLDQPTTSTTLDLENSPFIEHIRQNRSPLASLEVRSDPLFEPIWGEMESRGVQSALIIPLIVGDQVIGTIDMDSTAPRSFTEAELELAGTIANQASLAIEKGRLYNETLGLTIFNQAVVESIQQGIVVLDRNLSVRRVNRFMIERYGWGIDAVGKPLFDYRPDYADFLRRAVAVALTLGEPQAEYDIERLDSSGQRSIRNYYIYPMREGRNVTGIVLLAEDVTERARLETDLEVRAIQMAALSEVSSQITATLEPDQVISLVLDALARVIPYDGVSLWLRALDREELYIAAARGYSDPDATNADQLIGLKVEIPYSPLFREMSERAQVINAGDVSAGDPRFPYGSAAIYKNWLGAPLSSKGKVVGVLALEKREPNFYDPLHEQLALTFANQAAVALDNARLFQETRARATALDEQARRLALLNRVALALAQSLDLENIFEIALHETAVALGITEGAAMQIDIPNQLVRLIVEYPRGEKPPSQAVDLAHAEAIERVQHSLIPLAIENLAGDPFAAELRPLLRRSDVESVLLVPLVVGGMAIGLLCLEAVGERRQFLPEQIELAQTIASQAAVAVQNAGLFEQSAIRTFELETLFESAQATAVTLDLNEVARRVTMQMLRALDADACTVFLWDDVANQLEVRGEVGTWPEGTQEENIGAMCSLVDYPLRERALRERELIIVRVDDDQLPPGEAQILARHKAATRILIPLIVNEVSIGLVEIEDLDTHRRFKIDELRLVRTLASQAAISIENARLQTETRRTVEELYIINDMSAALSSATDLGELLEVVGEQLPNLTDAQTLYVALYDGSANTVSFPLAVRRSQPIEMPARPLSSDEFSLVIRRKAPLLLAGENLDQVRHSLGIETAVPEALCFLGVPLFAGEEAIGVLAVQDEEDSRAFSHNDQRILTTVGSQLGVAIQNARLFQQTAELAGVLEQRVHERTAELEQERQHISTLYQIATELATSLDIGRLLGRALEMVAQAVNANQGAILAADPNSNQFHFRARYGWEAQPGAESLSQDEGLIGWVLRQHQNLVVDDVQLDPRWLRLSEADDRPRSAMVTLLETSEEIIGVLMLYSDQPGVFNQDHLRLVTAAANQVATAMSNAELYNLIRDQAERLGAMLHQEQVEATKSSAILDSVADGVMVADAEGQVIIFNKTAEQILRLPAEQVLHHPTSLVSGVYGGGASRWAETVDLWMREPSAYRPGDFLEERMALDDGRVISVRLSPVHMADQFLGTVSVFRDITRDVEVDRLKSEFVATVSHELRTPMTSIKGFADLLLLGAAGSLSEQQQRFLETIKQNADRLSILVNDLLDISRIDQGRADLKLSLIDLPELIESVVRHIRGRSEDEKRPMNIYTNMPTDRKLTIWGDYDKIVQIFINLMDNAFNYTLPGGDITVTAAYREGTDRVLISVTDTGIGIQDEIKDHVYERFFRGNEAHELVMDTPGTGLGLAIVQEFVQMHRGHIWFETEVGKGTTFYVELPTKQTESAPSSVS